MLIYLLENTIQDYDWGHPGYIRDFVGKTRSCPNLQAELWMGAHPKASSAIKTEVGMERLDSFITRNPELCLGKTAIAAGWKSLPFLFKLLAAGKPLSIQSHPNLEQARAGFLRENTQGISMSAANRNYKDDNHKPEIIVAISDFCGLCGFRPAHEISFDFDALTKYCQKKANAKSAIVFERMATLARAADFKALSKVILTLGDEKAAVIEALCQFALEQSAERYSWLSKTAQVFPGDIGLLFFLVLNLLNLKPGESFYAPAGVLHAYVAGFGLELMANSDNVLRGGLTPKHIDVPELMATLDTSAQAGLLQAMVTGGVRTYAPPVSEFRLDLVAAGASLSTSSRAEIWLAMEGEGTLTAISATDSTQISLQRGQSVFVMPSTSQIICGPGLSCARAYIPE